MRIPCIDCNKFINNDDNLFNCDECDKQICVECYDKLISKN